MAVDLAKILFLSPAEHRGMAARRKSQEQPKVNDGSASHRETGHPRQPRLAREPENECRSHRDNTSSDGGEESEYGERRWKIHVAGEGGIPHGVHTSKEFWTTIHCVGINLVGNPIVLKHDREERS